MSNFGALSSLQYAAGDSLLHRLDPRSKFCFAASYSVTLLLSDSLTKSLVCMGIALLLYVLSKLHLLMVWRNMKGIIVLLLIADCFHTVLYGVDAAALMTIKIISFFMTVSLMFTTTPPERLIEGLRKIVTPLRRLGLQTETFIFMFTVAFIYIPLLLEDMMRIMQAQRVRGLHRGTWNIAGRLKDMFYLLTPLFLTILRRAERLSDAMESRCFHPGCVRTSYVPIQIAKPDIIVFMLALLLPFLLLCTR